MDEAGLQKNSRRWPHIISHRAQHSTPPTLTLLGSGLWLLGGGRYFWALRGDHATAGLLVVRSEHWHWHWHGMAWRASSTSVPCPLLCLCNLIPILRLAATSKAATSVTTLGSRRCSDSAELVSRTWGTPEGALKCRCDWLAGVWGRAGACRPVLGVGCGLWAVGCWGLALAGVRLTILTSLGLGLSR